MKLNVRALATAGALIWAGLLLLVACGHRLWGYGDAFLRAVDSLYPGYHADGGWGSVIVVALYALLDGAIAGALLAWLYNRFA